MTTRRRGSKSATQVPLVTLRLNANLTLSELAAKTGIDKAIISQIERGRMVARADEIAALNAAFGVRLETRQILVKIVDRA